MNETAKQALEDYLPSFVNDKNIKAFKVAASYVSKTFNRLTLDEVIGIRNRLFIGKFTCTCGNVVYKDISGIVNSRVKSCGCLQRESTAKGKHKLYNTPIYRRWASMKSRCKDTSDMVYGGKGISYTSEWETFEKFYEDMHEGFEEHLELDRIDVTKGYCKENCRWVDHSENNYNKNKQSNNTTGKTGVSLMASGKYRAYITKNAKQTHIGVFECIEDAVKARIKAEIEVYGYTRP